MIVSLLLAAAAAQAVPDPREGRFDACVVQARTDPVAARAASARWQIEGGSFLALECTGIAETSAERWTSAALAFEGAAQAAASAKDKRAATYWAQAGNAWLAGGNPDKARLALDTAIASGLLSGLTLGEAQLDRARANVAGGRLEPARADLDAALTTASADPMAWLLSATLARRTGDLPRAGKDIVEALRLAGGDPAVQLEAGNIAAARGDADGARAAWREAARLAPNSAEAVSADAALAQFGAAVPQGAQSAVGR